MGSDTASYDENVEVVVQDSNVDSDTGQEGDNVSLSSKSSKSSSHHHYHSNHTHHRNHHVLKNHHHRGFRAFKSPEAGNWGPFKWAMGAICVGIIIAALYIFISKALETKLEPETLPQPLPKLPWSGDFGGRYLAQNGGAFAKDSKTWMDISLAKEITEVENHLLISEEKVGADNSTESFKVAKSQSKDGVLTETTTFTFKSGVPFTQQSIHRKGKPLFKFSPSEPDFEFINVTSTISIKDNIWREVQHGQPEIKIKRIFFDSEMTAIFQAKGDTYVVKYNRKRL